MKILFYILFFLPIYSQAQINYYLHRKVLQKDVVDSEYIFGKWNGEKGKDEIHIKYLGQFTTKSGEIFKIVNSFWIWGLSGRGTCRIIVFNNQNQYVGDYYVGMPTDLPGKLLEGKLIFDNKKREGCDKKLKTIVDLTNGLPKQFFLKCKGGYGDIYTFESF